VSNFPRTVGEITSEWLTGVLRESGAIRDSSVESFEVRVSTVVLPVMLIGSLLLTTGMNLIHLILSSRNSHIRTMYIAN
jgi:hypothetical protein